jgi:hypothetical protein
MVGILSNLWWPRDIGSMPSPVFLTVITGTGHIYHGAAQPNTMEITKLWAKIISRLQTRGVALIVHHAPFPLTDLAATNPGGKINTPKIET